MSKSLGRKGQVSSEWVRITRVIFDPSDDHFGPVYVLSPFHLQDIFVQKENALRNILTMARQGGEKRSGVKRGKRVHRESLPPFLIDQTSLRARTKLVSLVFVPPSLQVAFSLHLSSCVSISSHHFASKYQSSPNQDSAVDQVVSSDHTVPGLWSHQPMD